MSTERIILLSVRNYSFPDEKSGRQISGSTATYLSPYPNTDPDRKGQEAMSCPADISVFNSMPDNPVIADAEFAVRPNFKGKACLSLLSFKVIKPLDIFDKAAK